jgi:predicted ATPase/DNA-binding winged helix-turn-helix (wHTH) protein
MSVSADTALLLLARFELQPAERRLLVDGHPARLGARAFNLLHALAERPGHLVSKQDLMDAVWHDLVVTDNNIQQQVSALRKLLGAHAIETVPGVGYRFVADVDTIPPAAVPVRAAPKTNLPCVLPPLIGRERELATLRQLVRTHRLVTATGAGGIGKSRLAQAVLLEQREWHPHGVCLVDLSGTIDPCAVPGVIASAVGLPIGGGTHALQNLIEALAPLGVLLALDNTEHLAKAVAAAAGALQAAAPHVHLLVTSQTPLKLSGEQVYRLGPLALPAGTPRAAETRHYGALALFSARAQAADRNFEINDDNIATIVEVCRRLDGVALAIELAAARMPLLGLPTLAASLDQHLRLLTAGSPTAPPRQQTLRAALEWSHGLLCDAEQRVFRRLAVVSGSASLETVQQVAVDDAPGGTLNAWAVLDALGTLVDRSFVTVAGDEPEPRYRLLDTPRSHVLERLRASGEDETVGRRHVAAMRARFEPALDERHAGRIGIDAWCRSLEPDCDSALAAVRWACAHGDAASALAIAPALHAVMSGGSRQSHCAALWQAVEPLLDAADAAAVPSARFGRAATACSHFLATRHPAQARARALQAIRALRRCGDCIGLYIALDRLCWPLVRLGRTAALQVAVGRMRALEDPTWAPAVKLYRAECEHFLQFTARYFDAAMQWAQRQAACERAAGWTQSLARSNLVHAAVTAGRAAEILDDARDRVAQLKAGRDRRTLAFARYALTTALLATHATAEARSIARDAWREVGAFGMQVGWIDQLALLAALEGRPQAAARLAGYADALYAQEGERRDPLQSASVERALALAAKALGQDALPPLRAEGAMLREGSIVELAFGESG